MPIYFYSGERQILHARLRLGCSSLNANYLREDKKCTCGLPETATHFFYECNNYAFLRTHGYTRQNAFRFMLNLIYIIILEKRLENTTTFKSNELIYKTYYISIINLITLNTKERMCS